VIKVVAAFGLVIIGGKGSAISSAFIRDRSSGQPASSQIALFTAQDGSYQEAMVLLSERGLLVDSSTLRRVAQSSA